MQLVGVTWQGPPIDDAALLEDLPPSLRSVLEQRNGFVQLGGGLHVRGACTAPEWHSLRDVWTGPRALAQRYAAAGAADVPFAEDCLGNPFLLREGSVLRLDGETGALEPLGLDLFGFLERAQSEPVETLRLEPLLRYRQEQGAALEPGELLMPWPPLCTEEAASRPVELRAVPSAERLDFLASLAARVARLEPGGRLGIRLRE